MYLISIAIFLSKTIIRESCEIVEYKGKIELQFKNIGGINETGDQQKALLTPNRHQVLKLLIISLL